ncbi:MAG: hypothetical protein ACK2T0_11350 [Anaerolineales bacterium]|jgi:hypothetical protein
MQKQEPDGKSPSFQDVNATRLIATTIGVIFGFSGINHGIFEFVQGNVPTNGPLIHAIGEAQRFWPLGTEDAFTLAPTFRIAGALSILVGVAIVIWSVWFLPTRQGRRVFLGLFILLFLVGGGIGQVVFFVPAWAFATRIDKPLTWWKRVLPRAWWPFLSRLWVILLVLSTISILVGLEIAIFGYVPWTAVPDSVQNTGLAFVFASAVLNIMAFIAGFGHDLLRMDHS